MNKKTSKSLTEALTYFGLKTMPDKDKKDDFWIRALAKVVKTDGNEYYVYVEKDKDFKPQVKIDFGDVLPTVKILEIYPFSFLKPTFMPPFSTDTREERLDYLAKKRKDKDYSNLNLAGLNKEITRIAMSEQLALEKRG